MTRPGPQKYVQRFSDTLFGDFDFQHAVWRILWNLMTSSCVVSAGTGFCTRRERSEVSPRTCGHGLVQLKIGTGRVQEFATCMQSFSIQGCHNGLLLRCSDCVMVWCQLNHANPVYVKGYQLFFLHFPWFSCRSGPARETSIMSVFFLYSLICRMRDCRMKRDGCWDWLILWLVVVEIHSSRATKAFRYFLFTLTNS